MVYFQHFRTGFGSCFLVPAAAAVPVSWFPKRQLSCCLIPPAPAVTFPGSGSATGLGSRFLVPAAPPVLIQPVIFPIFSCWSWFLVPEAPAVLFPASSSASGPDSTCHISNIFVLVLFPGSISATGPGSWFLVPEAPAVPVSWFQQCQRSWFLVSWFPKRQRSCFLLPAVPAVLVPPSTNPQNLYPQGTLPKQLVFLLSQNLYKPNAHNHYILHRLFANQRLVKAQFHQTACIAF